MQMIFYFLFSFSASNNWLSSDSLVATCAREFVHRKQTVQPSKFRRIKWTSDAMDDCQAKHDARKLTIGVHVALDKISMVEKKIRDWESIVSLAVFVPVANLTEGLTEWQRFVV